MAFGKTGYNQTIACIRKQGTLYNTFTTAKSMLTSVTAVEGVADAAVVLPPGFFYPEKKLLIKFSAGLSNVVTTPGTFTINVMLGAVIAFTTGAITITTTAHTLIPIRGEIELVCDTAGNGTLAKLRGLATLTGQMLQQAGAAAADNATLSSVILMPNTAPALGTGFDATVQNILDFQVGFSISNASNGFQLWTYEVVDLN